MKCSLLTLSTYIDGELATERRAEIDAHIVGCSRCAAGVSALREENARIGQLARLHVTGPSARAMLDQIGIIGAFEGTDDDDDAPGSRGQELVSVPGRDDSATRPWLAAGRGRALPWRPRRPDALPAPHQSAALTGAREPRLFPASSEVEADAQHPPEPAAPRTSQAQATVMHRPPPPPPIGHGEILATSGEDGLAQAPPPPPMVHPQLPGAERLAAQTTAPPAAGAALPPPRRVAPTGAAGLLARAKDSIAVRLALSRPRADEADDVQIVSAGAGPARRVAARPAGVRAQAPAPSAAETVKPSTIAEILAADSAVELSGVPQSTPASSENVARERPALAARGVADEVITPLESDAVPARRPESWTGATRDVEGWNAFAASTYGPAPVPSGGAGADTDEARGASRASLGRHSAAVRQQGRDLRQRLGTWIGALQAPRSRLGTPSRSASTTSTSAAPASVGTRRVVLAVGGIVVLFVAAVLLGRSTSSPPTATKSAGPPTPATAPVGAQPQASSPPTVAPSSAPTPVPTPAPTPSPPGLTGIQSFGSGATGYQVRDLRYGAHPGDYRVVFDMAALSSATPGSPRVVVGFSDPTTLLVTFTGVTPSGTAGTPPKGAVTAVSVARPTPARDQVVYRFVLSHAVSATGLYLSGPVRFVLDLH